MNHVMAVITLCSLIILSFLFGVPDAWSVCTIDQRIELGKQGYDKGEVEKMCADSGDVWTQIISKGVEMGMNKLGGNRNNQNTNALSATQAASTCVTNNGTCPLTGGPVGNTCYCRAPNCFTFTGISK